MEKVYVSTVPQKCGHASMGMAYQCKSSRTYTDVDDGYNNHVEAFNSHAQSK